MALFLILQLISTGGIYGKHFTLPIVPRDMTYGEYKVLTWEMGYEDYLFSSFIPGYMHFMLDRKKTAFAIVFSRLISTAVMVYGIATLYSELSNPDLDVDKGRKRLTLGISTMIGGFIGNLFFTAYDVAHGKWLLREMRARIFFKYRGFVE